MGHKTDAVYVYCRLFSCITTQRGWLKQSKSMGSNKKLQFLKNGMHYIIIYIVSAFVACAQILQVLSIIARYKIQNTNEKIISKATQQYKLHLHHISEPIQLISKSMGSDRNQEYLVIRKYLENSSTDQIPIKSTE